MAQSVTTNKLFYITGGHQPFWGNAYVIGGVDSRGNNGDAKSDIHEIIESVEFVRSL